LNLALHKNIFEKGSFYLPFCINLATSTGFHIIDIVISKENNYKYTGEKSCAAAPIVYAATVVTKIK